MRGNWVYFEYPLWVGLRHQHYKGVLNDFDVPNVSRKLEPSYRPCATITKQGPGYVTPNNGTVNVQQSILARSVSPKNAAPIRTDIPSSQSKVRDVRVFPGGGWSTDKYGNLPFLGAKGSLYLFSDSARPVQLQLHLVPTFAEPTVRLSEVNGQPDPMTIGHDSIEADLNLHRGITRIDMVTEPNAATHRRLLALQDVTLSSGGELGSSEELDRISVGVRDRQRLPSDRFVAMGAMGQSAAKTSSDATSARRYLVTAHGLREGRCRVREMVSECRCFHECCPWRRCSRWPHVAVCEETLPQFGGVEPVLHSRVGV